MSSKHPNNKLESLFGLRFYRNKSNWKLGARTEPDISSNTEKINNKTYTVPLTSYLSSPPDEIPSSVASSSLTPNPKVVAPDTDSLSRADPQTSIPETKQASPPCSTQNPGMLSFARRPAASKSNVQKLQDVNWTIMDNKALELMQSITSNISTMAPPNGLEILRQEAFRNLQYSSSISSETAYANSLQDVFPNIAHNPSAQYGKRIKNSNIQIPKQDVQKQTQHYGFTRDTLPKQLYDLNGYEHRIYPEQLHPDNWMKQTSSPLWTNSTYSSRGFLSSVVPSRDFGYLTNNTENALRQEVKRELSIHQRILAGLQKKPRIWINPALVAIGQDPWDDKHRQQDQELWQNCEQALGNFVPSWKMSVEDGEYVPYVAGQSILTPLHKYKKAQHTTYTHKKRERTSLYNIINQKGLSESAEFMMGAHCAPNSTLKYLDDTQDLDVVSVRKGMISALSALPASSGLRVVAILRNLVREQQRAETPGTIEYEVHRYERRRLYNSYGAELVLDGSHMSHDTTQLNSGVIRIINGRPYRL